MAPDGPAIRGQNHTGLSHRLNSFEPL